MKIMKIVKTIVLAVVSFSIIMMLAGCGSKTPEKKISLVIVGGGHSCMPVFSNDIEAIDNNLFQAAYTHGKVTMISCDGSPEVLFQAAIPEAEVKGLSENKQKRNAQDYVAQMKYAYEGIAAQYPEVNTLNAILLAARALSGDSGMRKILVIVDNGLQTTGYMNFANGLLDATPEDIVEALAKIDAVPDLSGVECQWVGCGDTIGPQEELSERQKNNLKMIWEEVLHAAGAKSVVFASEYSTNTAYQDVPPVTTVAVENLTINVELNNRTPDYKPIDTIILDSARLEFVGDQAVFIEEKKANEVLEQVAEELRNHPANNVYIIGTTAGEVTNAFTKALSENRAALVKDRLTEMGIPSDRMIVMGLGSDDPFHEYDLDSQGNLIEEIAQRNRKTIIMDMNSEEALLLP